MQRGVDLSDLDVSYVSSLALYFLLMFGLNDVYAIMLGEGSEMDEQRMMQMQVIYSLRERKYRRVRESVCCMHVNVCVCVCVCDKEKCR